LTELTEIVPTTANVMEYATIIKNKSTLRKLQKAGNLITGLSYDEETNISELLEQSEKSLFDVTQTYIKNKLVPLDEILSGRYDEFAELHENPDLIKNHRLQL